MTAMVREQERTANNLANANTIGYKRDRMFTEVLAERLDAEQAPRSDRNTVQWADLTQGPLEQTGNPLDLALRGDGFFVVSGEGDGAERYTRAGRFVLDADGLLRTPTGALVEGADGPLQLPTNAAEIMIAEDGSIRADGHSVGQLRVVTFDDPTKLRRSDDATFEADGMAAIELERPTVLQGYVESSNVDPIEEMTEMIEHFRLFETQQKILQSHDQVLGAITRDLGRF